MPADHVSAAVIICLKFRIVQRTRTEQGLLTVRARRHVQNVDLGSSVAIRAYSPHHAHHASIVPRTCPALPPTGERGACVDLIDVFTNARVNVNTNRGRCLSWMTSGSRTSAIVAPAAI